MLHTRLPIQNRIVRHLISSIRDDTSRCALNLVIYKVLTKVVDADSRCVQPLKVVECDRVLCDVALDFERLARLQVQLVLVQCDGGLEAIIFILFGIEVARDVRLVDHCHIDYT